MFQDGRPESVRLCSCCVSDRSFNEQASLPSNRAGPALPCDSVTAFAVEDQNEHIKKMGRWRADTARVLRLDAFWNVIAVSHAARLPLQRMHLFCQHRFGDGPDEHGQEGGHIRRLVAYRGNRFEEEYIEAVRDADMWFQSRLAMAAIGETDHSEWLCRLSLALMVHYYSSTMRRTIKPLRRRAVYIQ